MKPIKTHRCKELLEYNKNNYKPCAIQYGSLLNYFKEKPACKALCLNFSRSSIISFATKRFSGKIFPSPNSEIP